MANFKITTKTKHGDEVIEIDKYPDTCPVCNYGIKPTLIHAIKNEEFVQTIFHCPKEKCQCLFISYYQGRSYDSGRQIAWIYELKRSVPSRRQEHIFPSEIKEISKDFCVLYNESEEAEFKGLNNICGAGYRKALEFLIKDYLIKEKKPQDDVRDASLGTCIDKFIDEKRIKECAKRAAWLGNDQTHYYKKWKDKDLDDLKALIDLTVAWIHSEHLTKKFTEEMPEGKSKTG